jgi:ribosomal protein L18E
VATITDDARLFEVPKLRVAALKFTETARARIVKVRRAFQGAVATAATAAAAAAARVARVRGAAAVLLLGSLVAAGA